MCLKFRSIKIFLILIFICNKMEISSSSFLSHESHAEDLQGVPELFDNLFSSPVNEWSIVKFPVNYDTVLSNFNLMGVSTVNCTVVYFDHCISWNMCRHSCISIGASSYRWFHNACCECVESTCLNYGLNESRCKFCPAEDDDEFDKDNCF